MKISIAKETSPLEERVILQPEEVREIVRAGHTVMVEKSAGAGIYFTDQDYENAGAQILEDRFKLFHETDMVVKLKSPTPEEFGMLNGNILFSMLHHRQNPVHLYYLGRHNARAVEMESIKNLAGERIVDGTDMTGEAGVLEAIRHIKKIPSEIHAVILGYGRVGSGAIRLCNALGISLKILRKSEYQHIEHFIKGRDLLINAIAWLDGEEDDQQPLVTREMLKLMNPGGVILDLAVDYPSPVETSKPTSLSNPWYIEEGIVHIAIYGYPGLVPISSTARYSKQVMPAVRLIANNDGLKSLELAGELGLAVSNAVVEPELHDWQSYAPKEHLVGSLIE